MKGAKPFQLMVLLVFLLALSAPILAQTASQGPLTNADIVRMMRAGISENIIVREIQASRTDFGTSATELIDLKNQGASERVLGAVIDSRSGFREAPPEPSPPPGYAMAQSAAPGPHHLPSFEANVRVNGKKNKISVGQNHIKVEQAGVPLFSLKWKDNGK